jgi:uncharacterized protein (TIGR02145 family)
MKKLSALLIILSLTVCSFAQNIGINDDGSLPNANAILDVKSNTKGFLPPRMSYDERNSITNPPAGLVIWCTNCAVHGELQVFNGTAWTNMTGGLANVPPPPPIECGDSLLDTRDGRSYATVLIGSQCWMAQNLNYGTRIAGGLEQTDNNIPEKYCFWNNDGTCNGWYGALYQWAEMLQYANGATNTTSWSSPPSGYVQGLCPVGWHIPTDYEWWLLGELVGGNNIGGGKLKEAGYDHWWYPNTGATNESSFTALPAGYRKSADLGWADDFGYAMFWTLDEGSSWQAWRRCLAYDINYIVRDANHNKRDGMSVRCVKD